MKIHKKKKPAAPKKTKLAKQVEELENQLFAQKLLLDDFEKRIQAIEAPFVVSVPYTHTDQPKNNSGNVDITWVTTTSSTEEK